MLIFWRERNFLFLSRQFSYQGPSEFRLTQRQEIANWLIFSYSIFLLANWFFILMDEVIITKVLGRDHYKKKIIKIILFWILAIYWVLVHWERRELWELEMLWLISVKLNKEVTSDKPCPARLQPCSGPGEHRFVLVLQSRQTVVLLLRSCYIPPVSPLGPTYMSCSPQTLKKYMRKS